MENNTIDLDSLFNNLQEDLNSNSQPINNPSTDINWNEILLEWSYRLPKGYPTVVDGVFTERAEVEILNAILLEQDIPVIDLPEAVAGYDPAIDTKILNSPAFTDLINIQTKKTSAPTKNKVTTLLYVSDIKDSERAAKSEEIVRKFLKDTPKSFGDISARTTERERGKKNILINVNGYSYEYVLKVFKETASDTDVKEGFSVLFGYFPDAFERLTLDNVKDASTKLIKYLKNPKTNVTGLPSNVVSKMIDYLNKIIKSSDRKQLRDYASFLNQSISHGNTFSSFFEKNPDFYIERGELFNKIRNAGARISGFPADKWCPGDIYFIRNGSESSMIEPVLDSIANVNKGSSESERAAALAKLNGLFSSTYSYKVSKQTPIVAVSLKMADAQAGKLKSGLEQYSSVKTDYNLDKSELTYDQKIYTQKIKQLQKDIQSYISQEKNTKFSWVPFDVNTFLKKNPNPNKEALEILRFKYAAYKALFFICSKVAKKPTEVDTAILGLVSFGLGLIESRVGQVYINPPFFKVIANADGTAMVKPQFFKPGSQVSLIPFSGNLKNPPEIKIIDSPQFKGLVMDMVVGVGDDIYDVSATFRPNGSTQLTIELQKAHLR